MDLGIRGRVALVTASSRGLGLASGIALASEGVKVVLCAREETSLKAASAAVQDAFAGEDLDSAVMSVIADVTEPDAPGRLVEATVERFGRLDILVANAGGPPPGTALDLVDSDIEAALNANLLTSIRLVRASLPHMRASGWGRICCITSYSIKQPLVNLPLSNTARTGLWAWAKTAAQELSGEGITLNLACPGPHATDRMLSLGGRGPMGDPQDFGKVVAFLCSEPASYVNGAAVVVDGGASLAL